MGNPLKSVNVCKNDETTRMFEFRRRKDVIILKYKKICGR